ncbi:hypothetical protein [Paenibacillus sp. XY044]|uniref:hypothetical protein n=1 Tax=Paenibacillus sp. XY044 TaxID=2026089 RepID=UPI000B987C6A|nr:hypothetical protein [Paenibacillus sp. XY044]OZB90465.1 hypothetical protein CJP46_33440 [Paenibacillus sp. XY044]
MLKMITLLLGILSPLSFVSSAQPDPGHIANAQTVRQAVRLTPEHFTAFDTMNGVSLNDTKQDVIAHKGKPLTVTPDPFTGCSAYVYQDAAVVLCDGIVDYVHVGSAAGKIQINGSWIPLSKFQVAHALGQPQFQAEDGDVYIRGHHAVKVYTNPETGGLAGVDFFDQASE